MFLILLVSNWITYKSPGYEVFSEKNVFFQLNIFKSFFDSNTHTTYYFNNGYLFGGKILDPSIVSDGKNHYYISYNDILK
jgi:hypothetical protein